jgi:hypothetical protein
VTKQYGKEAAFRDEAVNHPRPDHNAAVPLWMRHMGGVVNPFEDKDGVDHAELRLRELKLPPGVRQKKPKLRDLRDAYLGRMMLHDVMIPWTMKPAPTPMLYALGYLQRQNGIAQLNMLIKELEELVTDDERTACHDAAKHMLAWSMYEWRSLVARKVK